MNRELTNDKIIAAIDYDADENDWYCETANLDTFLEGKDWHAFYAEGHYMTWENLSGYNAFVADDAEAFLQQAIGVQGATWKLWDMGDYLFMQVWHHDSPTGETRVIYPAQQCVFCGEVLHPDEVYEHDGDPVCQYHFELYAETEEVVA